MTVKKLTFGLTVVLFVVGMAVMPGAASAGFNLFGDSDDLGELFVLDALFDVGDDNDTGLGDLFILDQLFGSNGINDGGIGGGSDISDLFILDALFDIGDDDNTGLGDLFILDQLFNGNGFGGIF